MRRTAEQVSEGPRPGRRYASKSYSRTYAAAASTISLTSTTRPSSAKVVRQMSMTGVPAGSLNFATSSGSGIRERTSSWKWTGP